MSQCFCACLEMGPHDACTAVSEPSSGTAPLSLHVASAAVCLAYVVQTQLSQSQNKEESNVPSSPWVTVSVKFLSKMVILFCPLLPRIQTPTLDLRCLGTQTPKEAKQPVDYEFLPSTHAVSTGTWAGTCLSVLQAGRTFTCRENVLRCYYFQRPGLKGWHPTPAMLPHAGDEYFLSHKERVLVYRACPGRHLHSVQKIAGIYLAGPCRMLQILWGSSYRPTANTKRPTCLYNV